MLIVVVLHWVACGWYKLGSYHEISWIYTGYKKIQLENATTLSRYLYSLYWAFCTITTTGYGDIAATNQDELIFTTIMIILGDVIYGSIIGSLSVNAAHLHEPAGK
jgi:hypothetical protein